MTNVTYVFPSIVSVMWVLIDDQNCSSIMTSLGHNRCLLQGSWSTCKRTEISLTSRFMQQTATIGEYSFISPHNSISELMEAYLSL